MDSRVVSRFSGVLQYSREERFQGRDVLEMLDSNSPWPDRSVSNFCVDVAILPVTQASPKMYPVTL